ncbi:flagellar hook-basal body complex protein FliE [Sanguibacter antarcticus]|uniref:Flagellar hook-basal body complex protein FliE n=1 Tax=Sanguibacter antarcticus TaxID=372484 RepID=A0A2A9E216_9MICO|nr:flagellar hook-basal body complex protein FliE [Sanguibacter antarcticus]PFG32230.1 flagellar hook-basal body complex protein FliE [Sanguibacter antarcticus]
MSIPALESVSALSSLGSVSPTGYIDPTEGGGSTGSASGAFGGVLADAVTNLQGLQTKANDLAVQAVTGDLDDIHDYTIAASEAKVTLELTAAIRNKAVDAFSEIMRMQA